MSNLSDDLEQFNFVLQKHKFRIDSSSDLPFSLITDDNSGIIFTSEGNSFFTTDNTSTEVVGKNIPPDSDIPAKIIRAINGDIVLDANQGDIVLRGLNIRIESIDGLGGEITMNSSKTIQMNAPNMKLQSEGKVSITAANSLSVVGGSKESHGEITNEHTTGTDLLQSSFFGGILSALKKFKEFFSSLCG